MKRLIITIALFALAAPSWAEKVQEPRGPRPDSGRPESIRSPRNSGAMVQRWMKKLKKENPEEFERLNALRENAPEAFRQSMMEILKKERGKHKEKMKRPDRRGESGDPTFKKGMKKKRPHGPNKEILAQFEKVKNATSDTERQAARTELEELIRQNMEKHREDRLKKIKHIEKTLRHLKAELEQNDKQQEQRMNDWIDRMLPAPASMETGR